jgi:hypothetical protein
MLFMGKPGPDFVWNKRASIAYLTLRGWRYLLLPAASNLQ